MGKTSTKPETWGRPSVPKICYGGSGTISVAGAGGIERLDGCRNPLCLGERRLSPRPCIGNTAPVALEVEDQAPVGLFHDPRCTERQLPDAEARHKRERTIDAVPAPCKVTYTAALLATAVSGLVNGYRLAIVK